MEIKEPKQPIWFDILLNFHLNFPSKYFFKLTRISIIDSDVQGFSKSHIFIYLSI